MGTNRHDRELNSLIHLLTFCRFFYCRIYNFYLRFSYL